MDNKTPDALKRCAPAFDWTTDRVPLLLKTTEVHKVIDEQAAELTRLQTALSESEREVERAYKALEFADYLATKAELLIDAINAEDEFDEMDDDEFSFDDALNASEHKGEMMSAVRSGVYEFRKRRDKVTATPAPTPVIDAALSTPVHEGEESKGHLADSVGDPTSVRDGVSASERHSQSIGIVATLELALSGFATAMSVCRKHEDDNWQAFALSIDRIEFELMLAKRSNVRTDSELPVESPSETAKCPESNDPVPARTMAWAVFERSGGLAMKFGATCLQAWRNYFDDEYGQKFYPHTLEKMIKQEIKKGATCRKVSIAEVAE